MNHKEEDVERLIKAVADQINAEKGKFMLMSPNVHAAIKPFITDSLEELKARGLILDDAALISCGINPQEIMNLRHECEKKSREVFGD
jgi:hypothetical protein